MPKYALLKSNFIEMILRHDYSPVNLLHIFRTPFLKNASGRLLLYIIDEVCKAVVTVLAGTYLKFPSCQEDWENIEKNFKKKWNFQHCIVAVDGKHIEISGCGMGSQYYNYKATN